jgi:uncharacterized tellurite resistance protein B-like protein
MSNKYDSSQYDLLDDELSAVKSGLTNHEAFYAVMVAAMMSDGDRDDREREALDALAHRTVALQDMYIKERDKFNKMTLEIEGKFKSLNGDALSRQALEVASEAATVLADNPDMAYSAYAHAVDVVFADAVVRPMEKKFLKVLAEKLNLPPSDALEVLKFLNRKNKF